MTRLLWLLARYTGRAIEHALDALIARSNRYDHDDDAPTTVVGWVACPECGEELPIGLSPLALGTDEDGRQVASADLQMDDLWAHAWTHDIKRGD